MKATIEIDKCGVKAIARGRKRKLIRGTFQAPQCPLATSIRDMSTIRYVVQFEKALCDESKDDNDSINKR